MTPQRSRLHISVVGSLWCIGVTTAAWAHHPTHRQDTGGGWPLPLVWFLGACVFVLAFVVTWAAFSFFERRQQSESSQRKSSRRS
jgi:hypothetical protein